MYFRCNTFAVLGVVRYNGMTAEKFVVPKSVQDLIPAKTIWEDGIFFIGKNKYSKCYKFSDINYAVASREDKEAMFLEYSELLNSFDTGATTKITIVPFIPT